MHWESKIFKVILKIKVLYTEELYKKDIHDQDNHDGVITHIEPDILECEGKWALLLLSRFSHVWLCATP